MDQPQREAPSEFHLKTGERITGSLLPVTSGSDRMLQEIANCAHCLRPTYKVLIVTSAAGLERRAALCVSHFAAAARLFPELKQLPA